MAKLAKNNPGLKKGDTLYFIQKREMSYCHPVLDAIIDRVTTTADYVICHMHYYWQYASGPSKIKSVALFKNEPVENCVCDLTETFFIEKDSAISYNNDQIRDWAYANMGKHMYEVFYNFRSIANRR